MFVIPTKVGIPVLAGIQGIPAFAGMTKRVENLLFISAFFFRAFYFAFSAFNQKALATRTFFTCWFGPKCEFAIRITVAGVKSPARAGAARHNLTMVAFWAFDPSAIIHWFGIFAFGIIGAGKKFAKTAVADHHRLSAFFAFLIS